MQATLDNRLFITFGGRDGSAKTTQSQELVQYLSDAGYAVCWTKEPTNLVKHTVTFSGVNDTISEALLFLADRRLHTEQFIRPRLENNIIVVCDRYYDCTYAYQIHEIVDPAIQGVFLANEAISIKPTLTFWIDTPHDICNSRMKGIDIFESKGEEFYNRVIRGYEFRQKADPARIKRIDGTGSEEEVFDRIRGLVNPHLSFFS
jgi:dTMP kinase